MKQEYTKLSRERLEKSITVLEFVKKYEQKKE